MKNKILFILVCLLIFSCSNGFETEEEFRIYLRDRHPYSELQKVFENYPWVYKVNDTINNQILLYKGGHHERPSNYILKEE